jgi:hypothetical protein
MGHGIYLEDLDLLEIQKAAFPGGKAAFIEEIFDGGANCALSALVSAGGFGVGSVVGG